MTYNEYKDIICQALLEYCRDGGSLLYLALHNMNKEYIFEFDQPMAEDEKQSLINKAHQAIASGKDLPPGIRLIKVKLK